MFNSEEIEAQYRYDIGQVEDTEEFTRPLIGFSDVIKAHYCLADYFTDESAGDVESMSVGVRSVHLLGSALARQTVGYNGRQKYTDPVDICSTLFYGLVTDHPFVDGNKRTALLTLIYQLRLFGYFPKAPITDFEKLVVSVAEKSLNDKYHNVYKKFKNEPSVDADVHTVSYNVRRLVEKTDRAFHRDFSAKEFCEGLRQVGVNYTLENMKIKFTYSKRKLFFSRKYAYAIKFYGWTRPVEAGVVRAVFDALRLTEEYPTYDSVFTDKREPFYMLIKDFEGPLKRLKDK